MVPFLLYLLRVSLSVALVFVVYRALLRPLARLSWNRSVLIGGLCLSFLLPLTQLSLPVYTPEALAGWLPADTPIPAEGGLVVPPATLSLETEYASPASELPPPSTWFMWLLGIVYLGGAGARAVSWLVGLWQVRRLTRNAIRQRKTDFFLHTLPYPFAPCSHFGHVFVGCEFETLTEEAQQAILTHEQAHIRLRHSWDMIGLELARIFLWFHPLMGRYQEDLRAVHEYQADAIAVQQHTPRTYARLLIALSQHQQSSGLGHGFARALLKGRILRLLQPQTPVANWKYFFLLPLFAAMLLSSCGQWKSDVPKAAETAPVVTGQLNPVVPGKLAPAASPKEDSTRFIPSIRPIDRRVHIGFGMRRHPISKKRRLHSGLDFKAPSGTPVYATADGVILNAGDPNAEGGYGIQVLVVHADRYQTRYAHLQESLVKEGQQVKRGDVIAYSGNSGMSVGPHLHYEVIDLQQGEKTVRINPKGMFEEREGDRFL